MTTASTLAAIDFHWLQHPAIAWPLACAYILLLAMVCIYGLHRYWLVLSYLRSKGRITRAQARFSALPRITVQLPMFNESLVAERIIDAACQLDYPRDRLQVQVLDDSTDDCAAIARARVDHWAAQGIDVRYVHRADRTGFKAGALANGMRTATGRFIAIFDADFIPPADFLSRAVHLFTDERIGMVQARWDHLNRDDSVLTRSQAVFLDGHFVIEHDARQRTGQWINFNGTAGIWRREAIDAAGGWQHDTLTEDVDLSYRAQLLGWRFVYLPWLGCPAELPPETNAFKSQQHRWAKGSIQTAIKLLPTLLGAKVSPGVKVEAFFHLTGPMVYLYVTLIVLLFYPVMLIHLRPGAGSAMAGILLTLVLLLTGTVSAAVFYITSQRAQRRSGWRALAQIPVLMGIGVAIAFNNARGCVEALLGHESPFIRTPKYNTTREARDSGPDSSVSGSGKGVSPVVAAKQQIRSGTGVSPVVAAKQQIGSGTGVSPVVAAKQQIGRCRISLAAAPHTGETPVPLASQAAQTPVPLASHAAQTPAPLVLHAAQTPVPLVLHAAQTPVPLASQAAQTPVPLVCSHAPPSRFRLTSVLPTPSIKVSAALLELAMGGYMLWCLSQVLENRLAWGSIPFLAMFAWGYFYVGLTSLRSHYLARLTSNAPLPQVSA